MPYWTVKVPSDRPGLPASSFVAQVEVDCRRTGGHEGLDDRHRPRSLIGTRSRHRGGLGPNASRDRQTGCKCHGRQRKAQQTVGILLDQGSHTVHTVYFDQLSEGVRPEERVDRLGGTGTKAFAQAI